MAYRYLNKPHIRAIIDRLQLESQEAFELERDEILKHLWACATRDGKQFVDNQGRLLGIFATLRNGKLQSGTTLKDLPDQVTASINGIKQKRRIATLEDGTVIEEIETEIKLVDKAAALKMAMEHKGLFAPQQVESRLTVDFDGLYEDRAHTLNSDPVERFLQEEQQRLLAAPKSGNGNGSTK